ncbi:MAG: YjbQ family protein, partial [Propionibacteriaceae bacterium]|nr:YjbQ family protein [Propionibacteriaceae bacterium]
MSSWKPETIVRKTLTFQTKEGEWDIVDITDWVLESVAITDGLALVHTPHTSSCILVGENEERLLGDYVNVGSS